MSASRPPGKEPRGHGLAELCELSCAASRTMTGRNAGQRLSPDSFPTRHASAWLFDHFVGAAEQGRRHRQAQCFGGLNVDGQLVFDGRLHRQSAWLLALEDAIDVRSCAPVLIDHFGSIVNQTTDFEEVMIWI